MKKGKKDQERSVDPFDSAVSPDEVVVTRTEPQPPPEPEFPPQSKGIYPRSGYSHFPGGRRGNRR